MNEIDLNKKQVAIIGSGPSGLMAATILANSPEAQSNKLAIHVYERRPSFGRKLLIAGSSGLNISHDTTINDFISHYDGFDNETWQLFFKEYSPKDWIHFVQSLGFETFVGTSSRYFVREMKASNLLKAWIQKLKNQSVEFFPNYEWTPSADLFLVDGKKYDSVGLFLGGGSWEDQPPVWLNLMRTAQIKTEPFFATNVGYEVAWKKAFLKEAEGKPLKGILFKTSKGKKRGELVITQYGLEGTPIYFYGATGPAEIDLKPEMTEAEILEKLNHIKENLSPLRRVKKLLQLSEAAEALLFHHADQETHKNLEQLVKTIKAFPIELLNPRPLQEAISSGGGISLSEISTQSSQTLMLKKYPGIFCAGEMLAWTAPTGGFLIQACVTQGAVAGKNILNFLFKD